MWDVVSKSLFSGRRIRSAAASSPLTIDCIKQNKDCQAAQQTQQPFLQANLLGAAVVDKVELDIASAPQQLPLALRRRVRIVLVFLDYDVIIKNEKKVRWKL